MQRIWRIKDLLEWTTRYFLDRSIAESRLEAEVLLAHVLKKDRVYLYANYEEPVNTNEREVYREYIKRRIKGEPLAYITGNKEFMSLNFNVCPDVLIPRPDTEILVEAALSIAQSESIGRIIDVGTGSGAIAISLGVYLNNAEIHAVDISPRALATARENADLNQVKIDFHEGNLLEPFLLNGIADGEEVFDLITANLPYIPVSEIDNLDRQVKDFEPHQALFASGDGLDLYRQLIPQAYSLLRTDGVILMEIDPRQSPAVPEMMRGFFDFKILKDLAGLDRVIQARRRENV